MADRYGHGEEAALSHVEFGSIEGEIVGTTTYYGTPAIRIRERLTGADVVCVFAPDAEALQLASHIGTVWSGRRVIVAGEILYRKDGAVARIRATDMNSVDPRLLTYSEIADPNFTNGKSVSDHLANLWAPDNG